MSSVNVTSECKHLIIYADNGPESNSHRTQFLFRMVEFAKKAGLKTAGLLPSLPQQIQSD
ncbi:hypothetical protein [Endozoicomonas euniceicola]|uniref:Uncharacterized protein n=1 Tax=Endozoicomonas euniceicola TaxID=1234143 RepID=A0ABY6GTK4_9GAMM|nr:hypothetical protein [Endozoicomonas euniceicola]UYM16103.1 hypothetical protein NX720_25435 [Endozoicomonas euniceicola]